VKVAGESLVIVRTDDSSYSAYHNVCPHRAHELVPPACKGKLGSKVFVCPNHGWSFRASTGELVKARYTDKVAEFCAADFNLHKVKITEIRGLLFVDLSEKSANDDTMNNAATDSSDFADWEKHFGSDLKPAIEANIPGIDSANMQLLATKETVINANWKVLVDNFLECYHCDVAHKSFVDMVDLTDYTTDLRAHHTVFEAGCRPENKAYSFSPDDAVQRVFFCWLWPCSVVYSAPGSQNLSILQFTPLTPTTTLRRSERFGVVDATATTAAAAAAAAAAATVPPSVARNDESDGGSGSPTREEYLNQVLLEEDTAITESVQRGLRSQAYRRGRLVVSRGGAEEQKWHTEIAVAQFHHLLQHYCDMK